MPRQLADELLGHQAAQAADRISRLALWLA